MIDTGFTRQLDELCRLVVPKGFRDELGWKPGEKIYIDDINNFIGMSKEKIGAGAKRKLDSLGRIVIPKGIRIRYNISAGDIVDIYRQDNILGIRKHNTKCVLCGNEEDLVHFKNKLICKVCINKIIRLADIGLEGGIYE